MEKYLLISDVHGALEPLNRVLQIYKEKQLTKIICLGDLLYHGPRNDLPKSYNPKEVVKMLEPFVNDKKLLWIQGNCDSEVDTMVMKTKYSKRKTIYINKRRIILTHGHHLSRFEPDPTLKPHDLVIYGHYHVLDLSTINEVDYLNIGSLSIPKDNRRQFGIIEDKVIKIYDLDTLELLLTYPL